jgi:hypothetical protein
MQFLLPATVILSSVSAAVMGQAVTFYTDSGCNNDALTDYASCGQCKTAPFNNYAAYSARISELDNANNLGLYSDGNCQDRIDLVFLDSCASPGLIKSWYFTC